MEVEKVGSWTFRGPDACAHSEREHVRILRAERLQPCQCVIGIQAP